MPRAVTISTRKKESKSIATFTITEDNVTIMSKKIVPILQRNGINKEASCLAREFNHFLSLASELVTKDVVEDRGQDRKNFGNCNCTHPPSMGFCVEGMCVRAKFNFGSGSGSLTITINIWRYLKIIMIGMKNL